MAAAGVSKPAAKFTCRSPLPKVNPASCAGGALVVSPAVRRGCPEKFFPGNITSRTQGNKPKSSCADLIRASTPFFRALEGADGRAKPLWVHSTVASQPPSISRTARCKSGEVTLDHW